MKLYLELNFHSDGTDPLVVVKKMKDLGFEPVVGEYDFAKGYNTPQEYSDLVEKLSRTLKGTRVRYRLITRRK